MIAGNVNTEAHLAWKPQRNC